MLANQSSKTIVRQASATIDGDLANPPKVPDLAAACGVSASALRRAFKAVLGITPGQYLAHKRLEALTRPAAGGGTKALFDAGFGSVSQAYAHAATRGSTPARFAAGGAGQTLFHTTVETAVGTLITAATERGVCCVQIADNAAVAEAELAQRLPAATLQRAADSHALRDWAPLLREAIDAAGPMPDLPLDLRGTAFQLLVWKALRAIPPGQTRSYAQVAEAIGRPRAVRAVGTACGANRLAILIPCHRVLRGDGALGGYRWGEDRKRDLLTRERAANRGE